VAQCLPVPREPLDLLFQVFTGEETERYVATTREVLATPGVYRRRFRARRPRSRSGAE
jgi:hypothetical protein